MKNEDENRFKSMTTNERLFVSGLLAQFDDAVARCDLVVVRQLLKDVFVDEASIYAILKNIQHNQKGTDMS